MILTMLWCGDGSHPEKIMRKFEIKANVAELIEYNPCQLSRRAKDRDKVGNFLNFMLSQLGNIRLLIYIDHHFNALLNVEKSLT